MLRDWFRRWHQSMLWQPYYPRQPAHVIDDKLREALQLREDLIDVIRAHREAIDRQLAQQWASFHDRLANSRQAERLDDLEHRMSALEDRIDNRRK